MRFSEQSIFKYDPDEFSGISIEQILSQNNPGDMDGFKLSGLSDFREPFLILREYYENYPLISFKELRTNVGENQTEIDDLWHEPVALKLEFNRILKIRAKLELGEESTKHDKSGLSKSYDLSLHVGLPILFDADYWPRVGDEFTWRGILHSVSHVKVDPKCYFQNSSIPLHITLKSVIKQTDGSIIHQENLPSILGKEENNRPVRVQPDNEIDGPNSLRNDDGF